MCTYIYIYICLFIASLVGSSESITIKSQTDSVSVSNHRCSN